MQAYDVTQLVDLVTQPDGSIEIQPKQSDWDILSAADRLGWVDPGITEPLPATVERAREYLRASFNGWLGLSDATRLAPAKYRECAYIIPQQNIKDSTNEERSDNGN